MTAREIAIVAPNLKDEAYLLRPTPGFAYPAICSLHDLRTVYTLDDLATFHEILDLREAAGDRSQSYAQQQAAAPKKGARRW